MPTHDTEILDTLRAALVERIGQDRCDLWFGSIASLSVSDGRIVISAQDDFSRELVRSQFAADLRSVAGKIFPTTPPIEYAVRCKNDSDRVVTTLRVEGELLNGQPITTKTAPLEQEIGSSPRPRVVASPRAIPSSPSPSSPRKPRKRARFEAFVTGPCNAMAFTSSQHVIDRPGRCSPLLLFGPTSTGKTHLLEAIHAEARQRHQRASVLYVTAEQFTSSYVEALQRRELPRLRYKFRGVDFLLIDDVHFFAGKQATLVELQYTLDTLARAGKQIVMTSDRPPRELARLGQEIVSRISGGLVCELEPPNYETRLGIVRGLAKRQGLAFSGEVTAAIATHIATNAREIAGAINRLEAASAVSDEPITRSFADKILSEMAQQNTPPVGLPEIEKAVCDVFGVAPQALRSKRTAASVAAGRTLAMWLARKYTRVSLNEIGHYFGRRSHSTVISAGKRVSGWVSDHRNIQLVDQTCDVEEAIRRVEDQLRRA